MTVGTFLSITIDANDAGRVADFWAAVLGTERDAEVDDGRFLFLAGREGLPVVCIQRVPEASAAKTRIHLDLEVEDLETATGRILELGGSWDGVDRTLDDYRWRTVADPEGTVFDIVLG